MRLTPRFLAVLVPVALVLAACGDDSDEGTDATQAPADDAILEEDIHLRVRPADTLAVRPVGARRAVEEGMDFRGVPTEVAHDVDRVWVQGANVEPGRRSSAAGALASCIESAIWRSTASAR